MGRFLSIILFALCLTYQVKSQIIRSPLSLVGRSLAETILDAPRTYLEAPRTYEPRNYIEAARYEVPANFIDIPIDPRIYAPKIVEGSKKYIQPQPIIAEPPCNGILPMPNIPNMPNIAPSTTIITDCTPSVCKNLADTINLMIVSDLLLKRSDVDFKSTAPLLKNMLTNSGLAGYPNPISNLASNFIAPNGYAPNVVTPNYLPSNPIAPNLVPSSVYGNPPIASRVVAPSSVVTPNAPIDKGALLSSLLKLLGGGAV